MLVMKNFSPKMSARNFVDFVNNYFYKKGFYGFAVKEYDPENMIESDCNEIREKILDFYVTDSYLMSESVEVNKKLENFAEYINQHRSSKIIQKFVFDSFFLNHLQKLIIMQDKEFWLNIRYEGKNLLEYSIFIHYNYFEFEELVNLENHSADRDSAAEKLLSDFDFSFNSDNTPEIGNDYWIDLQFYDKLLELDLSSNKLRSFEEYKQFQKKRINEESVDLDIDETGYEMEKNAEENIRIQKEEDFEKFQKEMEDEFDC